MKIFGDIFHILKYLIIICDRQQSYFKKVLDQ